MKVPDTEWYSAGRSPMAHLIRRNQTVGQVALMAYKPNCLNVREKEFQKESLEEEQSLFLSIYYSKAF